MLVKRFAGNDGQLLPAEVNSLHNPQIELVAVSHDVFKRVFQETGQYRSRYIVRGTVQNQLFVEIGRNLSVLPVWIPLAQTFQRNACAGLTAHAASYIMGDS